MTKVNALFMAAAAGLVAMLFAAPATAAFVAYDDPIAFAAGLGGATPLVEDYEGLALGSVIPTGSTVDGITYDTFPAGTAGLVGRSFNRIGNQSLELQRDSVGSFFFPGDSFSVTFGAPMFAVGIYFNVVNDNTLAPYLFINTPVGTATGGGIGDAPDVSTLFFVGLISDTSFTTATFGATAGSPSGYNVDNLTRAAVPEPATLALLSIGLAGLAASRRRRLN